MRLGHGDEKDATMHSPPLRGGGRGRWYGEEETCAIPRASEPAAGKSGSRAKDGKPASFIALNRDRVDLARARMYTKAVTKAIPPSRLRAHTDGGGDGPSAVLKAVSKAKVGTTTVRP